jgi:hypothetical protein
MKALKRTGSPVVCRRKGLIVLGLRSGNSEKSLLNACIDTDIGQENGGETEDFQRAKVLD